MNTYAEEAKSKQVMQYLDGTMRQRQLLTNLRSEDYVVVGEQRYDFEGRPSVSILPAPVSTTSLSYQSGLNVFEVPAGWSEGEKYLYDNGRLENAPLSPLSGTSRYYSSSNDLRVVHRDLLPDGEGFVYSQTGYTNDNTGRLLVQSEWDRSTGSTEIRLPASFMEVLPHRS